MSAIVALRLIQPRADAEWPLLRILSMIVTDDPYASVKDKFCAGLAMFKNLHTLQIPEVTGPNFIFGEHGSEWFPRTLWRQPPLLSVRTMAIPWQLFGLLSCTPNLERLHIVDWTPRPWERRMYHGGANRVLYQVPYLKELTSTNRPLDAPWISCAFIRRASSQHRDLTHKTHQTGTRRRRVAWSTSR